MVFGIVCCIVCCIAFQSVVCCIDFRVYWVWQCVAACYSVLQLECCVLHWFQSVLDCTVFQSLVCGIVFHWECISKSRRSKLIASLFVIFLGLSEMQIFRRFVHVICFNVCPSRICLRENAQRRKYTHKHTHTRTHTHTHTHTHIHTHTHTHTQTHTHTRQHTPTHTHTHTHAHTRTHTHTHVDIEWVIAHTWKCHVTHPHTRSWGIVFYSTTSTIMNESWHTSDWVMSHTNTQSWGGVYYNTTSTDFQNGASTISKRSSLRYTFLKSHLSMLWHSKVSGKPTFEKLYKIDALVRKIDALVYKREAPLALVLRTPVLPGLVLRALVLRYNVSCVVILCCWVRPDFWESLPRQLYDIRACTVRH